MNLAFTVLGIAEHKIEGEVTRLTLATSTGFVDFMLPTAALSSFAASFNKIAAQAIAAGAEQSPEVRALAVQTYEVGSPLGDPAIAHHVVLAFDRSLPSLSAFLFQPTVARAIGKHMISAARDAEQSMAAPQGAPRQ